MDTRLKIVTLDRAVELAAALRADGRRLRIVSGYFDILQPAIVRAVEQLAGPGIALLALVLDPPRPVTSSNARAELAAALRVIDYVLSSDSDPAGVVERLQPAEWIRQESAHAASTERLIEHVVQRHTGELTGRQAH